MEEKLKASVDAARGIKRKRDKIFEALSTIRSISIDEFCEVGSCSSDDLATFLCAKLGWKSFIVLAKLLFTLPQVISKEIEQQVVAALSRELLTSIPLSYIPAVRALANQHRDLLQFSYDECVAATSIRAGIPFHRVLYPPTDVCLVCSQRLSIQSQPAHVTVFEKEFPLPGIKFCLKCQKCKTNYGYSMYGNSKSGYKFYDDKRPYVEASNVTYLARSLCLEHINLANHAWVSFHGFCEAYNEATAWSQLVQTFSTAMKGKHHYTHRLDRKIVSSAFFWHEIESELSERGLVWTFRGNDDDALQMTLDNLNQLRQGELYRHDDCFPSCKERGCDRFTAMDGIWKLRFAHCMFPVKAEVSGIPALNIPNVCTEEPVNRNYALCSRHSKIAQEKGIPTNLRQFIHDYCGIPRLDRNGEGVFENVKVTDVDTIDKSLQTLREKEGDRLTPSTVTQSQGTLRFLTRNKSLLGMDVSKTGDSCNKDTGARQKSLQKWSRGLMHFVRGSGIIDSWQPLFISESPSQAFLLAVHYLYLRLGDVPQESWGDFVLAYDNMCNLDKMNVAKKPLPLEQPYDKLWLSITKVIDRLHLRNHKDPRCKEMYNPDLLTDKETTLNTPVAEQTFVWAGRFKKILGGMNQSHFLFFYHRMIVHRNHYTCQCYKEKRQPILPKVRSENTS